MILSAAKLEFIPQGSRKFIQHNRSGRRGGGTGLLFKNIFDVKQIDAVERTSFEFSEWGVSFKSLRVKLSIIYRPPYSAAHPVSLSTFFQDFAEYLESIILPSEPLIITGDFNIHVDVVDDPEACEFADLLTPMGLKQHVIQATHEGYSYFGPEDRHH